NYQLPEANDVRLVIFDVLGNKVVNLVDERKDAGYHSVEFDGNKLSSGVYFYSISAGSFYQVNKMLLLK
ncbi:MAG: T9SS type A sorting domain-containing protein, partial [Bacteroidota bacterium]